MIHLQSEQPILADLMGEPAASDTWLICTNLRTTNGKTPVFAERADSTFVFPLAQVRFVEIRPASLVESEVAAPLQVTAEQPRGARNGTGGRNARRAAPEADGAPDAVSPLQRLAWESGDAGGRPEEPACQASEAPEPDDGDFLRRVREA